jgi:5-bromo-4-chloroindolyl phosphate hydrolysis protein
MLEKKIREAKWLAEHTLTEEQVKQLIRNKLERAKLKAEAIQKRESICEYL